MFVTFFISKINFTFYPFLIENKNQKPHPYKFGYEIEDGYGGKNSRHESGDDYGNVVSYYLFVIDQLINL